METQVRTPDMVFMQPQRLVVPLFQRPYVWNEENQWRPLWEDVVRVTERYLFRSETQPHFLGAVVLQQVLNPVGSLQERTIIDGQQRLTTLQLLLDALHCEFFSAGALQSATRIETLVRNPSAFCDRDEDRFKVWPTNRDRQAFNAIMNAEQPVQYEALANPSARLVQAHRYFSLQARQWLNEEGNEGILSRAVGLEKAVRELLQVVVIDLGADENAQEIFETLNARGTRQVPSVGACPVMMTGAHTQPIRWRPQHARPSLVPARARRDTRLSCRRSDGALRLDRSHPWT